MPTKARGAMLTKAEIEQYRELGYLVVSGVFDAELLAEIRRAVDAIIADAGKVTTHTDVYDLEESHTPEKPRVRRIKTPHKHFPFFAELTRNPRITGVLAQLIGSDLRLHGAKLNMTPMTTCWRPGFISTIATWRTGRCWSFPAPTKARSTITMPTAISSAPWLPRSRGSTMPKRCR